MTLCRHGVVFFGLGIATLGAPQSFAAIQLPAGFDLSPALNLDYQFDDNVTNATEDKTESWIIASRAEFTVDVSDHLDNYQLTYALDHGEYLDSEVDTYTDHLVAASADWTFNSHSRAALHANLNDTHEGRGSGFSQGSGDQLGTPDRYRSSDVYAVFGYGPESSRFRFEATLGADSMDYMGEETRTRDRSSDYASISSFIAAGGKTEFVAEIKRREINYDFIEVGDPSLDSRETDYLVGMDWASAKTILKLRAGHREKDFTGGNRERFSGPRWRVGIDWSPLSYSSFEIATERTTREVQGVGDYIDVVTNSIAWKHEWSESFSSAFTCSSDRRKVQGLPDAQRNEDRLQANLELNYRVNYFWSLSAGSQFLDQDSASEVLNYRRNISYVGFRVTL